MAMVHLSGRVGPQDSHSVGHLGVSAAAGSHPSGAAPPRVPRRRASGKVNATDWQEGQPETGLRAGSCAPLGMNSFSMAFESSGL